MQVCNKEVANLYSAKIKKNVTVSESTLSTIDEVILYVEPT